MKTSAVIWKPVAYEGLEHLTLREDDSGVHIESVVIGLENQSAFRLGYHLHCDRGFAIRNLSLTLASGAELMLTTDGHGAWFDATGKSLPDFDGCLDIDISATPFTNTLPIRRLEWQPGQTEILNMLYISVPDLTPRLDEQRYTCLEKRADESLFRFEQLSTGFTASLPVDPDGLVLDYPGLFTRLWSDKGK